MVNFNPGHGLSHGLNGLVTGSKVTVLNMPWAFWVLRWPGFLQASFHRLWKQPPSSAANVEPSHLWIWFTFTPPDKPLGCTHLHERLLGQLWCLKRNSTFQVGGDGISKRVPETRGTFHRIPTSSHCQVPAGE